MDALHFDLLGKRLATTGSRRALVRGLVPAAVAAAGLATFGKSANAEGKQACLDRCQDHGRGNGNCRKRCRQRFGN
ncbi:MAG: hypothetical protein IT337_18105 [Thermomicrobiales bacterium]|nr:hypothetical protein [Thermomicrobiales bacterium]